MKFQLFFLTVAAVFLFTSCEDEENVSKYSKSSFVGEWEAYKKRTVTKNKSTNAVIEDKTITIGDPYIVNMKENGMSTIDNDPLTNCEWELRGEELNIGCSDFYDIKEYSPLEFALFYSLTDNQTVIDNYTYYRRVGN